MHKHIIMGHSAASSLSLHLNEPRENLAIFIDNLILGKLSPVTNIDQFIADRQNFWENNFFDGTEEGCNFISCALKNFIEQIDQASHFTLWLSSSAHDQILWAWLVHVFDQLNKSWQHVHVKHLFNDKDTKYPYSSLGVLNPQKFVLCKDFSINDTHVDFLRETYVALQASSPEALIKICDLEICPLPELQQSLHAYLKLFPDIKSGLTICQKALLSACTDHPLKSARVIGETLLSEEFENRLVIGDHYLFQSLIGLSQLACANPLIHLEGQLKNASSMRFTEVSITELGKKVLAGEENNLALNGIDMYIGGTHLCSKNKQAMWFYDHGTLKAQP